MSSKKAATAAVVGQYRVISVSDISKPRDVVDRPSREAVEIASRAIGSEAEKLFFVIVAESRPGGKKRYDLVARYDVYAAAREAKAEQVPALLISASDATASKLTLSERSFPNPATIVRLLDPYAAKYGGSAEAASMLYMPATFGKMHEAGMEPGALSALEGMIQNLYEIGIRSTFPLWLFRAIAKLDAEDAATMIEKIGNMPGYIAKSDFRWPNPRVFRVLLGRSKEDGEPGSEGAAGDGAERKAPAPAREFGCACGRDYIVTDTHIGPRQEKDNVLILEGDRGEQVYALSAKQKKFLGADSVPPTVMTSQSIKTYKEWKGALGGRRFVVFVANDA